MNKFIVKMYFLNKFTIKSKANFWAWLTKSEECNGQQQNGIKSFEFFKT